MVDSGVDWPLIITWVVFALLAVGAVVFSLWVWDYLRDAPKRAACKDNPLERYAQPCNNAAECVSRCENRLSDGG